MEEAPAEQRHVPVLLDRCLDLLAPALDTEAPVVLDATLGMGGHTHAMLERFPHLRVVGIDRDPQALELAGRRLANFLKVMTLEAQTIARACGHNHLHNLEPEDLCALTMEAAAMAKVPLAGTDWYPGRPGL